MTTCVSILQISLLGLPEVDDVPNAGEILMMDM